ncbi:MAG TPA: ATP-binding protein [Gammaproteobacteria bacterium]|nr:ATP-binding protein [Gammaproteobacteria bacterium]
MKRDLYVQLLAWKSSPSRKPLILQGARQVGKTYILKEFGRQEYANCIYLNFELEALKGFFQGSLQPKTIIEKLSVFTEQSIIPERTLIIFDEIQECPEALNSLKYFQEQANEYHIVAAGSLLGVKLAHTKGFPVGKVNFLDLYPLSFHEFLLAIDKVKLREYLANLKSIEPLDAPLHNELLDLLKKYMFIGGMPEAISTYIKTNDLLQIRDVQRSILKAYDLDFAKHAPKNEVMRISQIWNSIPRQLAKENAKFVFSVVREGARGREYEIALQWLLEAGLIIKQYNLTVPKLPLPAYGDTNAFKVFMLDIGLLGAMADIPVKILASDQKLFSEYNGAFTENYVAQAFVPKHPRLYYWTSPGTAEVDFVLEHDLEIYPLEVKSGVATRKKSLLIYAQKYKPRLLLRTSLMNLKLDANVCNFPLYLISELFEMLTNIDAGAID